MSFRVLAVNVMNVITGHQGDTQLTTHGDKYRVYPLQLGDRVPLYFQVEIFKRLPVPEGGLLCLRETTFQDKLGNLAADAAGQRHQPLAVLLKQFPVDARFIVETLQVSFGNELYQVLVSGLVFGQEHQVIAVFSSWSTVKSATLSHVNLTTDNRFYAGLPGCLIKFNHAVHNAVVGDSQAVHT